MNRFTVILLIISTGHCFGQTGAYCGKRGKLRIFEIKKLFPYNQSKSIKLVSFKYEYPERQPDTSDVEVSQYHAEMPKTNGVVDLTKMFEVKTLNHKAADELLNILVNYDNQNRPAEVAFCYEPRNGIIFLNSRNSTIAYVEICFACLRYELQPSAIAVAPFCVEKFEALKAVFKKAGITYGVNPNQDR